MIRKRITTAASLLVAMCLNGMCASQLISPNGRVLVAFNYAPGSNGPAIVTYCVSRDGKPVIVPSRINYACAAVPGEAVLHGTDILPELAVLQEKTWSVDTTWTPVYGERGKVCDRYNALNLDFCMPGSRKPTATLVARAYNEGVAFSWTIHAGPNAQALTIRRESTEFRFPEDHQAWAAYTAQGVYTNVPLSRVRSGCERPMVVNLGSRGYAAIAEARLVDFSRMKLGPLPGADHSLVSELDGPVVARLPLRTPWRVIMLADTPGQLLENNDLILNLNDPCELRNTSWIKPGKVLRDKSLSTAGGKACIDFAVRRNLQYVLYDAGWYGVETSEAADARKVDVDPHRYEAPLDLKEVLGYAKSKDIGIILYVNRTALERQMDELFPVYRRWGVSGVKFGFVHVGPQEWTAWLHNAVRNAARHRLMVDIHDEYRPTGFSRTYPNLLTQEGVRGDEERQSGRQVLTTLFTRFLAGAADNTICYYDQRVQSDSSHAFQLAKMVCFYSPWQFVYWYDRPVASNTGKLDNNVIGDEPELEFIDACPTVWDDTRVLKGEIGEFGIVARRSGRNWFIGCMNANKPRIFDVPLSFLEEGTSYRACIYSDDPSTPTRTHVRLQQTRVDRQSSLRFSVAAQGGTAVRLMPAVEGVTLADPVSKPVIHSSDYSDASAAGKVHTSTGHENPAGELSSAE